MARLLSEDAEQLAAGIKGPMRFGVNHPADLSLTNSGTWSATEDGTAVWQIELHCPGAVSINLVFGEFVLPEDARVFVINTDNAVLGAFTQASSGGRNSLGVSPLPGDRITVRFECPASSCGAAALRITQVTHGYRAAGNGRGLGDSDACNNNTICPEGDPWRDAIASVAMVIANGNGWCTGQLINDCANDGTPYFLTANHCLGGQDPANWIFRFNWESPTCEPTTAGPTDHTVSGATLLENDPTSDVALLLLNTAPPASYGIRYTGWDATGVMPAGTTTIHHPSGDVKKISLDGDPAMQGSFDDAQCWHILHWDDGTTEGGSSGAGLWDPNGRLIGQLFGGQASCTNSVNDYFGRFDLSYPLLAPWLGTCGPPVIDGHDPNAPPTALDASLLIIAGIQANYCNEGSISPVLTIRNNGTTSLTQLSILYHVDNAPPNTMNWTGNLANGSTTEVSLPGFMVTSGTHVFHATCSAPNGAQDGMPANDAQSRSFHVADPGEPVTLTIQTDNYGSETIWQVASGGTVIHSGGPYADVSGGTTETAVLCLEEACFTFTIYDAVGDGICCTWGEGDFTITDDDGDVLLDGNGNFGASSTMTFCTGVAAIAETAAGELSIFPDPSDGGITVRLSGVRAEAWITVMDQLGRMVHREQRYIDQQVALDLSHLAAGRYVVEVDTEDQRVRQGITVLHGAQ